MKYLLIIILLLPMSAVAEEICLDEAKYNDLIVGLEMKLEPKMKFESRIEQLEVLSAIRGSLGKDGNEFTIEFIDQVTNSYMGIAYSNLMTLGKAEDLQITRLKRVIDSVLAAREKRPSSNSNPIDPIIVLAEALGHNKTSNPTP